MVGFTVYLLTRVQLLQAVSDLIVNLALSTENRAALEKNGLLKYVFNSKTKFNR